MRIIPFVSGIEHNELPLPQRLYTALDWSKRPFEEALSTLAQQFSNSPA
jgi:hypothetical protein